MGSGVNGYTLDAALGEFILTHPNVRNPILAVNGPYNYYFCPDQNSYSWQDLLIQRREFDVLPPSRHCIFEIYQISSSSEESI